MKSKWLMFALLYLSLAVFSYLIAQSQNLRWDEITEEKLSGRSAGNTVNPFQRFPDSMRIKTREVLWNLSKNPAGVYIDFKTNAEEILVKYQIEGDHSFPHMPSTGVSGVDIYMKDKKKAWHWVKGNYHFGDTIVYRFKVSNDQKKLRKFNLLLPLYNTVKWMKIGVKKSANLEYNTVDNKNPIVIYGTSITQGACASRPGNAWTSKLSRKTGIPVLNFGFSGNGLLEPEIINYLVTLNARVFILDCLANFDRPELGPAKAVNRLISAVESIRKAHPKTPIILTDHAGYPDGEVNHPRKRLFTQLNEANHEAYTALQKNKVENIYLLNYHQLGLESEDFVDGVHPTDGGMEKYAIAYKKLLQTILK